MGNAISRGAGSSSVCSLQTGTVIFITVQVFFSMGTSVTRLFGSM